MARISGVDLPREKRVEIGLTYIYGIAQDMHRVGKTGFEGISGGMDTEVLRQAVVLSEILAEPVCKRRHRRNRYTI